ncbi:hypothetical protein [Lysobacter gummosus]|uniref:hypothetical protein n=1 Tax=Lysobacter gummosus TaxID=262324 RepID=UPI0036449736
MHRRAGGETQMARIGATVPGRGQGQRDFAAHRRASTRASSLKVLSRASSMLTRGR